MFFFVDDICCSNANLELTDHRGHTAIMRAACECPSTRSTDFVHF